MEPRERSCLDRPLGLLFILAGAPTHSYSPQWCLRFKDQLSRCRWFPCGGWWVVGRLVGLQWGQYRTCVLPLGCTGFPAPMLTPGCSNDNISCLVPVVTACKALSNVAEMGRLLGLRLNEGHLVSSHHSLHTLEAVALFKDEKFSLCHRC